MEYLQKRYGRCSYFQDLLEIVEKVVATLIHTAEAVAGAYRQAEIGLDDLERAVDSFPVLRRALRSGRVPVVRACRPPQAALVRLPGAQGGPGWFAPAVCAPGAQDSGLTVVSLQDRRNFVIPPETHAPRITRYYMVYRGVQPLQASTAGLSSTAALRHRIMAAGARQGVQDPRLQLTPEAVEASLLADLVLRSAIMSDRREVAQYIHALSQIEISGVASLLLQHVLSLAWSSLAQGQAEQLASLLSVVDALMMNPSLAGVDHFTIILSLLLSVVGSGGAGVTPRVRERAVALLTKCLNISEQFDPAVLRKVGGILINGVFSPGSAPETRVGCARALEGVNSEEMFSLLVRKLTRAKGRGETFPSPEVREHLVGFCRRQVLAAVESGVGDFRPLASLPSLGQPPGQGGLGAAFGPGVDYSRVVVCGVPALTLVGLFGDSCLPAGPVRGEAGPVSRAAAGSAGSAGAAGSGSPVAGGAAAVSAGIPGAVPEAIPAAMPAAVSAAVPAVAQ